MQCKWAIRIAFIILGVGLTATVPAYTADNLKLNNHLDYSSDSIDGPLITGDALQAGLATDKPNYVMIYGEGCYNSKRQARRTVSLYERYRGRVNFVIIDLDRPHSAPQQSLIQKYYGGSIPDIIILDQQQQPVYDQAGEVGEADISKIFDKALR